MKLLLTGGAGYVGTSLIPQLLERGIQVRVFDNLLFGGIQLLPFFRHPCFDFQKGDIRDHQQVNEAVRGCDIIIHLAAIVGYPACRKNPKMAEEVNVQGTMNIIKSISKNQIVLYASTGSNYGTVENICTEETPLKPLSLYGQTKTMAENMLLHECSTIAYRFATAFGVAPRLRLDLLINDFTYKAFTQGYLVVYEKHFMRTFIHVYDMGRAFIFGIDNLNKMVGQIYNVGSERMNYSKKQICEIIDTFVPCYIHFADVGEDIDKRSYIVSYDKFNALGYKTSISVQDGIKELLKVLPALSFINPFSNI
jgi:nucleoside-diphosphate-sugar epimerase